MRGKSASVLKQYGAAVQEYLLASLGQAAGMCPEIAVSPGRSGAGGVWARHVLRLPIFD